MCIEVIICRIRSFYFVIGLLQGKAGSVRFGPVRTVIGSVPTVRFLVEIEPFQVLRFIASSAMSLPGKLFRPGEQQQEAARAIQRD